MDCLKGNRLLATLAAAVCIASCGDSPRVSVDAPDALGSFAVGYTDSSATDASRDNRMLPIGVWYPVDEADAADRPKAKYPLLGPIELESEVAVDDPLVSSEGPLPLLVFSHGFGAINMQSTQLMEALASHGFITVSPEHTGNTAFDMSDPKPDASRVPDVSFIIDAMFERSNTADDAFEGRIDESKVGVLGHSFGGSTAMGMVAGWAGAEADPRVKAIGVIAGDVASDKFSEEVLAAVTAPTILLVGTLDRFTVEHDYAFANMPNAQALFKVEVIGANHTHFANVCALGNLLIDLGIPQDGWGGAMAEALIEPYNDTCTEGVYPIAEAQRLQNLYMVAHFKRYLLGNEDYDEFLTAAHAEENEPAVSFVGK